MNVQAIKDVDGSLTPAPLSLSLGDKAVSKSETRSSRSERRPKPEVRKPLAKLFTETFAFSACKRRLLRSSAFGFLSGFGLLISDFAGAKVIQTQRQWGTANIFALTLC